MKHLEMTSIEQDGLQNDDLYCTVCNDQNESKNKKLLCTMHLVV